MDKKYDLTEQRFDKWLVIGRAPNDKDQSAMWFCRCDCGTERAVHGAHLRRKRSKSCGCYQRSTAKRLRQLPDGEGAARQLYRGYKHTAGWKNREFSLSLEDFKKLAKGVCYYCGVPPSQILLRKHNGGKTFGTPYKYNGVDRLDSSKGYTLDNCVPCCGIHNKMKLAMSPHEFYISCCAVVDFWKGREQLIPAHSKVVETTS